MILLSFIAPFFFGIFVCNYILGKYQLATPVLSLSMALGTGIGICSATYITLNLLHLPYWAIFILEFAACGYLFWKYRHSARFNSAAPLSGWWLRLLAALFVLALATDIFIFFADTAKDPHGLYDAWSYWNLRAKFISRAPSEWADLFKYLYFFHGDYPLLHSGFIARGWLFSRSETVWVPIITAFSFTFATIGLLYAAVSHFSGRLAGIIAALAMLCTPFYMVMGDSQYVDSPAGYFFLISIVLLAIANQQKENQPYAYLLAGLAAGLSAWTKNEGLLFIIALYGARIATGIFSNRKLLFYELKYMSAGLAPILLLIVYFKLRIAPVNDLLAEGNGSAAEKLKDMARYAFIWDWFKMKALDFGRWYSNPWWLLVFYALGTGLAFNKRPKTIIFSSLLLLLMLTGYFFIYVTTYIDLNFHLSTSLHRLYFQLLPSFLFVYFVSLKSPEYWFKQH